MSSYVRQQSRSPQVCYNEHKNIYFQAHLSGEKTVLPAVMETLRWWHRPFEENDVKLVY